MAIYNALVSLNLSLLSFLIGVLMVSSAANFYQDVEIVYGDGRAKILDSSHVTLSLDQSSGSGLRSKAEYLFGKFDMQVKLVPGNSAGTVTSFYLQSPAETNTWDEIDFEFLGNLSGDPYIVHTNVYYQGKGNREQQFYLWFDPTADFHTYSILWNPLHIVFYVDGKPIREYKNMESIGVAYPKRKPMRIYATIWDAEDWATRGGVVKTNWSSAPFTASFRNFNNGNACVWSNGASSCNNSTTAPPWLSGELDTGSQKQLQWVQKNFMIYNYCTDTKRFPQGLPPECTAVKGLY